jgi:Xaa-Pro aminopeptidase
MQERLASFRAVLAAEKLDAYIIPTEDDHQSEYIAPFWKRREWLTGFTGSAGDLCN